MQELEHGAVGEQAALIKPVHDFVVHEGGATFVHHLGLPLRIEVLRQQPHDAKELALPVVELGRVLLEEVEQVLLGQAETSVLALHLARLHSGLPRDLGQRAVDVVVGRLLVGSPARRLLPLELGDIARPGPQIAADPLVHQRVRCIKHAFDDVMAVAFLALGHIGLGEGQIVDDVVGLRPHLELVVVFEEVVVPVGGMRQHEGLHGHGVLLHDVADAGVGIDDQLVGKRAHAALVVGLVVGEALAERPVPVHQRHADRGVGIEHLLGRDNLDLVGIDVESELAQRDVAHRIIGLADQIEAPLRPIKQRAQRTCALGKLLGGGSHGLTCSPKR